MFPFSTGKIGLLQDGINWSLGSFRLAVNENAPATPQRKLPGHTISYIVS